MLIDITTLPDTTEEFKALVLDLDAQYRGRIELLEERNQFFQKQLFGRKTEKLPAESEGQQLHLFNEAETLTQERAEEKPLTVPEHTCRHPKRKHLPKDLLRVEVIHDIDENQKIFASGVPLSRIGKDVSEKHDIVPAKIQVIRDIRYKYACKNCKGAESEGPAVKIAPTPAKLIPMGLATVGLVAYITIANYSDALTLYRQEKTLSHLGIEISRSTIAGWMVKAAESCESFMGLLRKELICEPLINADEIPVQVLDEPSRTNTTRSYMWVFRGGTPGKELVYYRYSPTRSGDVTHEVLQGYRGYLHTDAYAVYQGIEEQAHLVDCFCHVRRNFVRVIDVLGKGVKKTGSAEVALGHIRKLNAIEKTSRRQGFSPPQLYEFRKEKAEATLAEFKAWIDKLLRLPPPEGLLGKALNYAFNHWPKLNRYVEDGHIRPDNNTAENAISFFVAGRKNWLFAGHPNEARASAPLSASSKRAKPAAWSLMRTCAFCSKRFRMPGAWRTMRFCSPRGSLHSS